MISNVYNVGRYASKEGIVLWIQETFYNTTKGHQFSHNGPYETCHETRGDLFRALQSEYGKATTMYRDPDGQSVGWVFSKRMEYDDAHRIARKADRFYVREVWVEIVPHE